MGENPFDLAIKSIPELMGLVQIGISVPFNQPDWYISAMFIAMLPLCYILLRNRDLYLYVFAPFIAVILYSILFNNCADMQYKIDISFHYKAFTEFARAVCGMSFGAISWLIYEGLCKIPDKKRYRSIITFCEIIINILFFYTCFVRYSSPSTLFCAMLLIPPMVAVAFSRKSYVSKIFKNKLFKSCGSLSLTIYLNHWIPSMIASVFIHNNLLLGFAVALALTIVFALINTLAVKILKAVGRKIVSKA